MPRKVPWNKLVACPRCDRRVPHGTMLPTRIHSEEGEPLTVQMCGDCHEEVIITRRQLVYLMAFDGHHQSHYDA